MLSVPFWRRGIDGDRAAVVHVAAGESDGERRVLGRGDGSWQAGRRAVDRRHADGDGGGRWRSPSLAVKVKLSLPYWPGVKQVCKGAAENFAAARVMTAKVIVAVDVAAALARRVHPDGDRRCLQCR